MVSNSGDRGHPRGVGGDNSASCRFHGGDEPDLADIAVFGVIRSVTCTDTFMDLMHNSRISDWYEQMMKAVGDSSRLSAS